MITTPTPPHQALYRRWRAQTFGQIVGQEAVVETLRNAVRQDRVSHAILFVGPRGTGKTSLARILAKALNCTNLQDGDPCDVCPSCVAIREGRAMDLVEIDAASNRGIDAIRELRERIHYAPADLRRKVYILDEAHQITKDAWNALLKSLEEPPDFVVFMFASTHPQEFPPAILSRLQRYDVRRLTASEIEGKLRRILEADGRSAEPAAVELIARLAAGGMRDAESMLDQLLTSTEDALDEARVRELLGLADAESIDAFIEALVTGDPAAGLEVLDRLDERGRDARVFLDQVVDALRSRILAAVTARSDTAGLASAARRLAAIDPNRAGVGGLRLQLEVALLSAPPVAPDLGASATADARSAPAATAPVRPATAPTPTTPRAPRPSAEPPAPAPAERPVPEAAAATSPASEPSRPGRGEPVPASDPAPPPLDALGRLLGAWPAIVGRISERPALKPLVAVCRPIAAEDRSVTLGFPEEQAFFKDVAARKQRQLEEIVEAVLGHPVAMRFVVANLEQAPALPADADAAFVLAEARRIFADDLVDVGEVS